MNFSFLQKDNHKTKRLTFVVVAVLIATLADLLFIREMPGINVFVFVFAYLFGFSAVALLTKNVQDRRFFLLSI
ncbi:MAG: hypothetical protein ACD_19C00049G0001, partial [uncultured bacterium]